MASLSSYQRLVIRGKGPGSEIWQTSFSTVVTTAITSQAGLQSYVNSIAPFVNTWWTTVKASCSPLYSITDLAAYQYVYPSTSAQFQASAALTASVGTMSVTGSPVDTAVVISLRTAVPGRRTRGRMYVPCHLAVSNSDACFPGTNINTINTATKTMFNSILTGTAGGVAVVSRTGGSYELITGLVADNKPDVQRRRENKLVPTSVSTLTFP